MDLLSAVLGGGLISGLVVSGFQFLSDRYRTRVDREMSLRREVFFEAATACAKYQDYLTGFLDTNVDNKDHLATLQGATAAFYRTGLIAALKTIEAFGEVDGFFIKSELELTEKRLQLQHAELDLSDLNSRRQNLYKVLEIVTPAMLAKDGPEDNKQLIRDRFNETLSLLSKTGEEIESARGKMFQDREPFAQQIIEAKARMEVLVRKAILVARKEIKLKIDEEAYMKLINHGSTEALSSIQKWVKTIGKSST
jgi:hypothetical protein